MTDEGLMTKRSVLERLGLTPVINANGATSRLGGNLLSAAAQEAMIAAGQFFVPLNELQARASETISRVTGAEAGCVASGSAACLFLATAACMAGSDIAAMDRLPNTEGLRNEIVMQRAHRNPYDHALRATGARIVEVGYLGPPSSPGTRSWEVESAITDNTCACFYLTSGAPSTDVLPLRTVADIAHDHGVPLIVDAAGAMPPATNLTRFIEEGADLVAFSGGKGIGGPAASGFLAGRRDLVLSATLQQQDMYIHPATWSGPFGPGAPTVSVDPPRQGMGRMLKVGREEIAGLIAALEDYVERDDVAEEARNHAVAAAVADGLQVVRSAKVSLVGPPQARWHVVLDFASDGGPSRAAHVARNLRQGSPRIFCLDAWIDRSILMIQPSSLREDEVGALVERVTVECEFEGN
jgi:D-glucosaminate-6-phosphate ammonia-lyase